MFPEAIFQPFLPDFLAVAHGTQYQQPPDEIQHKAGNAAQHRPHHHVFHNPLGKVGVAPEEEFAVKAVDHQPEHEGPYDGNKTRNPIVSQTVDRFNETVA